MEGARFLKRAVAEGQRYGEDPWVFFRELGQNSRDAFASRIDATARWGASRLTLVFSDNGRGMTFHHARRYLFRLYASSKDSDTAAAGRFGVGFWSVLRFRPVRIEVHSRCGREAWAVSLSGDLESWESIPCRRKRRGTSVVLVRDVPDAERERFRTHLEAGLVRYLGHLRSAGRHARPLPVHLDGKRVNRPFRLRGAGSLRFREGDVEGVVGFGSRPSYQLYARGLPVTQGAYLEELEGKRIRGSRGEEREGAAPVYLLNGNNLDVVLSRQTVLRDRALRRLLDVSRRRFDQLVSRTVGCTVQRSLPRRLLDGFTEMLRRTSSAPAWTRWSIFLVLLLFLGAGLGALLAQLAGGTTAPSAAVRSGPPGGPDRLADQRTPVRTDRPRSSTPDQESLYVPAIRPGPAREVWTSTVDAPAPEPRWDLRYEPGVPLSFRLIALNRFDERNGWQPARLSDRWRPADPAARDVESTDSISVSIGHDGSEGDLLLPVPSGYVPVGGSARAGHRQVTLRVNPDGLVRVFIPRHLPSPITFRVAPDDTADFLDAGRVELPAALDSEVAGFAKLEESERISRAMALVQGLVAYDRSHHTARAYRSERREGWVERVLAVGAGDCDVMNGLLVLLLKRAGVRSRLVVGFVGREGRVLAGTHAWVEVDSDGLQVLDATVTATRQVPAPDPTTALAEPSTSATTFTRSAPAGTEGSSGEASRAARHRLIGGGLILMAVLLVLLLWGWWRSRGGRVELRITPDALRRRKLLAGMAVDAIYRPGAWMEVPGLWHSPFIPCHGGKVIALARLIRAAGRDQLFVGSRDNPLVAAAVRSGVLVLDRSDEVFAELFARIANLRDLDELARLVPVSMPEGPGGDLLRAVDTLLRRHKTGVVLRPVRPPEERPFWDVDLTPIRLQRNTGWPRRFVGVNPGHRAWEELSGMYPQAPALALCLAVDRLLELSSLLRSAAPALRRAVAARVLRRQVPKTIGDTL